MKWLASLIFEGMPIYYVHCLAQRLQLALIVACREVILVQYFFTKLASTINIIGASSKRTDELHNAQFMEFAQLLYEDEIETGRGLNQMINLQRTADTRWNTHLKAICSLMDMFVATCPVLKKYHQ